MVDLNAMYPAMLLDRFQTLSLVEKPIPLWDIGTALKLLTKLHYTVSMQIRFEFWSSGFLYLELVI